MLFNFLFNFSNSSHSHQSHVIIQVIIKFGMDHLLEGFPKAIKQTVLDITGSLCLSKLY